MSLLDEIWKSIKFNFVGHEPPAPIRCVWVGCFAQREEYQLAYLKGKLNKTNKELKVLLNVPDSNRIRDPLRYKYVYEYHRKFGTLEYNKDNIITEEEWLKPIDNQQDFIERML